jgi:hypothetical protein
VSLGDALIQVQTDERLLPGGSLESGLEGLESLLSVVVLVLGGGALGGLSVVVLVLAGPSMGALVPGGGLSGALGGLSVVVLVLGGGLSGF